MKLEQIFIKLSSAELIGPFANVASAIAEQRMYKDASIVRLVVTS